MEQASAPVASTTSGQAEGARAVPVQGSSGGFKLKLTFGGAPVVSSASRSKPLPAPHSDDEEDQLESSGSSSEEEGSLASGSAPRRSMPAKLAGEDSDDSGSVLSSVGPSEDDASASAIHPPSSLPTPGPPMSDDVRSTGDGVSEAEAITATEAVPAAASPPAKKKRKAPSSGTGKGKGSKAGATASTNDGLLAPPKAKSKSKKKSTPAAAPQVGNFGFEDPYTASMASGMMLPPPPPRERRPHDPAVGPPPPPPVSAPRPWPTSVPPKPQTGFLPSQPLEKRAPRPRVWRRALREMIGVAGYPIKAWTFAGDPTSEYAHAKQQAAAMAVSMPPPQGPGMPPGHLPPMYLGPYNGPPGSGPPPFAYDPASMPPHSGAVIPPPMIPVSHEHHASAVHPDYRPGAPALGGPPLPASFNLGPAGSSAVSTPEKATTSKGKGKGKAKAGAKDQTVSQLQEAIVPPPPLAALSGSGPIGITPAVYDV